MGLAVRRARWELGLRGERRDPATFKTAADWNRGASGSVSGDTGSPGGGWTGRGRAASRTRRDQPCAAGQARRRLLRDRWRQASVLRADAGRPRCVTAQSLLTLAPIQRAAGSDAPPVPACGCCSIAAFSRIPGTPPAHAATYQADVGKVSASLRARPARRPRRSRALRRRSQWRLLSSSPTSRSGALRFQAGSFDRSRQWRPGSCRALHVGRFALWNSSIATRESPQEAGTAPGGDLHMDGVAAPRPRGHDERCTTRESRAVSRG
jgi:hypothetical protein